MISYWSLSIHLNTLIQNVAMLVLTRRISAAGFHTSFSAPIDLGTLDLLTIVAAYDIICLVFTFRRVAHAQALLERPP